MGRQIFERAKEYDFEAIKDYIEQGGEINICNEAGVSLFASFVEGYLMEANECEEVAKKETFPMHDEYDYDFWDSYVYDFQITPLDKRRHNIKAELEYLLEQGADPNLCRLVKGMTETALYYAVCIYQDYYLTKFLLEKGADPCVWLFDKNERFGEKHSDL